MSNAPKYLPWTNLSGNYPVWLTEYWAMVEMLEKKRNAEGELPERSMSGFPKPRLSFLVNCLRELRAEPTLIGRIRDFARRYPNPEDAPEQEDSDLAHFVGAFLHWLELKDGKNSIPIARTHLYALQANIERGARYSTDADAIRREVWRKWYIDDLENSCGG